MEISVSHQAFVFGCMVLCGLLTGVIFDFFRGLRRCVRTKDGFIAAQDIAFWLVEVAVVYCTMYFSNNAGLRLYEAVAMVLGAAAYFLAVSKYVLRFWQFVVDLVLKPIKLVAKGLAKFFALVSKPLQKLKNALRQKVTGVKNNLKVNVKIQPPAFLRKYTQKQDKIR